MQANRLRVVFGEEDGTTFVESSPTVKVTLAEVIPVLADALAHEKNWLRDLAEEEITISDDLYEVILAYQQIRRSTA